MKLIASVLRRRDSEHIVIMFFKELIFCELFFLYFVRTIDSLDSTGCADDYQAVNDTVIVWTVNNSYKIISQPPCVDEHDDFVERKCINGEWEPRPQCYQILGELPRCPSNLKHSFYGFCYTITEPQEFPPKCPDSTSTSPTTDYEHILRTENISEPVWLPVRRDRTFGLGDLEWNGPNKFYGKPLNGFGNFTDISLWQNDCMTLQNYTQGVAVNCNSLHRGVCISSNHKRYGNDNVCLQRMEEYCKLNKTNLLIAKCFCPFQTHWSPADACKLANSYYHQISSFKRNSNTNENCWVDLKEKLKYFFSTEENSTMPFKSTALHENGTILSAARGLKKMCGICERSTDKKTPKLRLQHDLHSNNITLTIDFPEELGNLDAFCFTNANQANLKLRYPDDINNFIRNFSDDLRTYEWPVLQDGPGYYWCEAFHYIDLNKIQSDIIFVQQDVDEYALNASIKLLKLENNLANIIQDVAYNLNSAIKQATHMKVKTRVMKVLRIDQEKRILDVLFHVTSFDKTVAPILQYDVLKRTVLRNVTLINFLSVDYCMPFNETTEDGDFLQWNLTRAFATTTPLKLCLQENGLPVTRTCVGDFMNGARWSEVNGSCYHQAHISRITQELHNLQFLRAMPAAKARSLKVITQNLSEASPVDIFYVSNILEGMSMVLPSGSLEDVKDVVANVMKTNRDILNNSQQAMNSTDTILYNFDLVLSRTQVESVIETPISEVTVLIVDITKTSICGFALINDGGNLQLIKLNRGDTYNDLFKIRNLETAAFLPEELLTQIQNSHNSNELKIIFTLFSNDALFNEESNATRSSHNIFSVLIPNFTEKFSRPISMFFKSEIQKTCVHWNYGVNEKSERMKGRWMMNSKSRDFNSDIQICEFWHATHFALLFNKDFENLPELNEGLKIVTLLGCILSIIGVLGILITGILFRSWRKNEANQILMHFGVNIVLQIIVFYAANYVDAIELEVVCIVVGALLQYTVLSEFFWMLFISILQYRRLVLVFGAPPNHLLLQAIFTGWIFPVIPTLLTVFLLQGDYIDGEFCYPTGSAFIYGILIPIASVMLFNTVAFVHIIISICCRKVKGRCVDYNAWIYQLRMVILLFFLLGMTWTFGLVTYFGGGIIFAYLFCLTATLQGFMVFLFFIPFNKSTRGLYRSAYKKAFGVEDSRKSYTYQMVSTTTTNT